MAVVPATQLTDSDFERGAKALGVDDATVRAVAQVESRGEAFLPTGEPKILFERHIFSCLTGGKWDKTHPDISYPKWIPGTYGPESTQHARLQRAVALDRDAALQSASWGAFQVMGFNWKRCGFKSLQAFVNAVYAGVGGQLDAMIGFVKSDHELLAALRDRDWSTFAHGYNGVGYKANRYDEKLAAAYVRHGGKA